MKLQQFLKENTLHLDFDYLEKFRDEVGDAIANFDETLRGKGFKIIDITTEPDDESNLNVVFSNKILEVVFDVTIKLGSNSGDEVLDLNVDFSISDDYAVGSGKTLPAMIDTFRVTNVQPHQEQRFIDGCSEFAKNILELSDHFFEWYMDVSSEYGKVKLYVDHKSKPNNPSIKACAGEFDIESKKYQVY